MQLLPDEVEASALLALLLLQDSRRDARVDDAGELVLLGARHFGTASSTNIPVAGRQVTGNPVVEGVPGGDS